MEGFRRQSLSTAVCEIGLRHLDCCGSIWRHLLLLPGSLSSAAGLFPHAGSYSNFPHRSGCNERLFGGAEEEELANGLFEIAHKGPKLPGD